MSLRPLDTTPNARGAPPAPAPATSDTAALLLGSDVRSSSSPTGSPAGEPAVLPLQPTNIAPSSSGSAAAAAGPSAKPTSAAAAASSSSSSSSSAGLPVGSRDANVFTQCLPWLRPPPSQQAAAPGAAAAASGPQTTPEQKALMNDLLHCNVDALFKNYNNVNWNFTAQVVGRTLPQSPLGLLLRPELNYGNLSRMSRADQYRLVQHVLSLPENITPRLDSHENKPGPFRQTMSTHVIQAIYQGRVDLIQLLYDTAADRARQGTGVAFDLREKFFPSKITLLHMAAHDGRQDMCRWLVARWAEEAEKDPHSQTSKEFTPDVVDGAGQTPLFWTFARGTVDVGLARFFVDECTCDFFRVFELKPNLKAIHSLLPDEDPRLEPKMEQPYYCSAFSLAIELAPGFAEEQLAKKSENMGTRFQWAVIKFDFEGITLRREQIRALQAQTDILNAQETEKAERLEGKKFLAQATTKLKAYIHRHHARWRQLEEDRQRERTRKRLKEAADAYALKKAKMRADAEKRALEAKAREDAAHGRKTATPAAAQPPAATAPAAAAAASSLVAHPNATTNAHASSRAAEGDPWADYLDITELRFVSPEAPGDRPPKDRWDTFWYDDVPLSAVELMVKHGRRRLLLTPIMHEIQTRLWVHLQRKYLLMLVGYGLFGLLFAINTGIWPRTSQMVASDVSVAFPPYTTVATFRALYFVCNLGCILLCAGCFAFHARAIYEGANTSWRGGGLPRFCLTLVDNVRRAFRTGSSQLDLAIIFCFIVVQCTQWSMLCHVPQCTGLSVCGPAGGAKDPSRNALPQDTLGTYTWFASALHLLLGFKFLELVSVFEFAGPLLSTLLGMFRDVARFAFLFGIGYCAFTCSMWIVLKDVFPPEIPSGLQGPADAVTTDTSGGGLVYPEARYSYSGAMVDVLLWVFLSFDFDSFNHTTLGGSASLGRILFLAFLLIMVLVMLNLMIAMFSSTYADVACDAEGEWHIRYSSVLCQLLRMSGEDARLAREYVLEMGVDNHCGKDCLLQSGDRNVELLQLGTTAKKSSEESTDGGSGGGSTDGDDSNVAQQVQALTAMLAKMRQEQRALTRKMDSIIDASEATRQQRATATTAASSLP